MRRFLFLMVATLGTATVSNAQSFSINTDGSIADTSAILDIKSTSKGVLVPRMTKAERNLIFQPATGLLIFQSGPDSSGFHYYNGTAWVWLSNASPSVGWLTTGNAGTDSTVNFLGTLDAKPIMFRYNNTGMGQLNPGIGSYFIGKGAGLFNNGINYNVAMGDSAMANNTTGGENTALGYYSQKGQAGLSTGGANTSLGARSLMSITTGGQNVAIGHYAMASMQSGNINIVLGPGAMEAATKGSGNIGMGLWALRENDSASNNVALGTSALYTNRRDNNIGIGFNAGYLNNYLQTDTDLGIQNTYLGYQSGYYANTGSKNVAIGYHALRGQGYFTSDAPGNTAYKRNIAIGDSSMVVSFGSDNVGIGYKTLTKSAGTNWHVAIGSSALSNTTAAYPNTAIGYRSQDSASTGYANTSIGSFSLGNNKTGVNNTAIGNAAMYEADGTGVNLQNNTAIGNNALRKARYYDQTAIGADALSNDTSGVYNTAVGYVSLYQNLSGTVNTAVGVSSLRNNLTGSGNTALGTNAMFNHKYNYNNTSVGYESMFYDTSGINNTVLGWRALRFSKNPYETIAIGVGAHEFSDSAWRNIAIGRGAMIAAGGTYNTAIGTFAAGSTNFDVNNTYTISRTTSIGAFAGNRNIGSENTFVGYNSGYGAGADTLRGIENTGLGAQTLVYTSTGKSNTALGMGSLFNNTTGNGNVGVGTRTLVNSTTGSYNIAIGDSAMWFNGGNGNVAIGTLSLSNNAGTGSYNSAVGHYALGFNFSGNRNSALGDSALSSVNSGSYNTAVGYMANTLSSAAVNATAIGSHARVDANNSLVLGSINGTNGAAADTKVGIGTTTPDSLFSVADSFMVNRRGEVQYKNGVDNMMYMFQSPGTNNIMVIAHSPSFTNYGLQYQDNGDKFNFIGGGTNAMTIEVASGQIGLGTTTPAYQLELSLNSAAKPGSNLWTIPSDQRLKNILGSYTRGIKDILKLNAITYNYTKDNVLKLPSNEQFYGFSAQDVQKVFPEAVKAGKDGYLSFDFHPILVSYINAFKEQQQQIDDQKKQLDDQKKLIEELIKRVEKLETK